MNYRVELLAKLGTGLVTLRWSHPVSALDTRSNPVAVWSACGLRKNATCAVTGAALPKGQLAYRPIGNQDYRMQRIHPRVIDGLLREAGL